MNIAAAEDQETCLVCNGVGLRDCDHIGTGRDQDGWCTECDYPAGDPRPTTCDCQE